jgi:LacI family transcriptional regulator
MAVTMKNIAQELGLSIATVSKVIRDHPDISAETRERVRARLKELNYRPNLAARALVTGKTYSVGLVVPDLVHPFFGEAALGLSRALRRQGYDVIMFSSEEDLELERRGIEQLLARKVDALVVASASEDLKSLDFLMSQHVPYVLIDRRPAGFKGPYVGVDDLEIGRMATEHLIRTGRKVIAHVGGPGISTGLGRLAGYRKALEANGMEFRPDYVIRRQYADSGSDSAGFEAMKAMLKHIQPPDGVFCYNDPTAMGAMEAALAHGLRIPEDVAFVGAGNVRYAQFLRIPLTSVDQQSYMIGERAGKLALSLIQGKPSLSAKAISLKPELVIRESSRPAKGPR